jgi:hypothetical protein
LFCDPDELLVTPHMRIEDLASFGRATDSDGVAIPRFNVTAPRSVAINDESRLTATDALVLRIDTRHVRSGEQDIRAEVLQPSWVFTAIGGKVFVRLRRTTAIGEGDHSATTVDGRMTPASPGIYLLHYPFRGYATFKAKVEMARIGFAENPHLSPSHGWQVRRWIQLADAGKLRNEYLDQFIADDRIDDLVGCGVLSRDVAVPQFHRRAGAGPAVHQGAR